MNFYNIEQEKKEGEETKHWKWVKASFYKLT